ncbi:hypothetical protein EsDP_00007054 [Epichloe bromicola]|uniref:Aminoglycoside phosphotransferase domain-containing protein n=1 Tax=Epichloe bromicola TaxID=79588 RepID=A0ABQ0CZU9_9HYPO
MASHETQNLELKNILAAVSQLNIGGNAPFFDGEFNGGECRVFKLSFKDQASIAIRVRHPTENSSYDDTIAIVQTEVRILQTLEAKGFFWAPRCRGASLTFDNPVKHPFIVREGKIPSLSEQDCLDQQALLYRVLGLDRNSTVFAMDHGDIKPGNIIVDEEYNIKCIIDWGFAAMVPIARSAILPRFLWPDDSARFAPSLTVLKDRQAYIGSFSSQTSQAALFMLRWQDAEDVDFRTLYLDSISSKGVHTSMARVGWKLSYCAFVRDAEEQSVMGSQLEMLDA